MFYELCLWNATITWWDNCWLTRMFYLWMYSMTCECCIRVNEAWWLMITINLSLGFGASLTFKHKQALKNIMAVWYPNHFPYVTQCWSHVEWLLVPKVVLAGFPSHSTYVWFPCFTLYRAYPVLRLNLDRITRNESIKERLTPKTPSPSHSTGEFCNQE